MNYAKMPRRIVLCLAAAGLGIAPAAFGVAGASATTVAHHHVPSGAVTSERHQDGHGSGNDGDGDRDDSGSPHSGATVLFVSPSGVSGAADSSCSTAAYSTIGSAVAAASPGGTVNVCAGTYKEDVVVSQKLTLVGQGATIDATNLVNGIQVTAAWSQVDGFTVENALGEGILVGSVVAPVSTTAAVMSVSNVTIEHNVVTNNDLGAQAASPSYPECQAAGAVPGDCGEGIHLDGAVYSTVANNEITGNSGGVLLSDEAGPTAHNVITENVVTDNLFDCGITLASHNPNAFNLMTSQPVGTVAGIYDNVISNNVSSGNGTKGEGAGVLIAAAGPGTALYDNTIWGNVLSGNELSGVTVHAHSPGVDVNGNQILHNSIFTNNTGSGDLPNGPMAAGDLATTGILVYSAALPVTITIRDNEITGDATGIWLTNNVTALGIDDNSFFGVGTNVFTSAP
jgi:parallel beta-helix repeat protein